MSVFGVGARLLGSWCGDKEREMGYLDEVEGGCRESEASGEYSRDVVVEAVHDKDLHLKFADLTFKYHAQTSLPVCF